MMKPRLPLSIILLSSLTWSCAGTPKPAPQPPAAAASTAPATPPSAPPTAPLTPPIAHQVPYKETLHGSERVDEYRWLRQKGTPEVVDYLNAENAYAKAMMEPTAPLQKRLYDEMLGRIKQTDVSVPTRYHNYFYYQRTTDGQQYPIYCRKSAKGAKSDDRTGASAVAAEEVLLDLNELGRSHKFVGMGQQQVSGDGTTWAYLIDLTGFRQYTLHIKDLTGARTFNEEIPRVDDVEWAADGKSLFYVVEDEVAKRPYRLYRHIVGQDPKNDALVYEEKDERFDLILDSSRDEAWLVLTSASKTTTEVRVLPTKTPLAAWRVVEPRQQDVRYYVGARGGDFYIRTDAPAKVGDKKARNFRLVTAPTSSPGRAHWKELVPHRDDVMLDDVQLFADRAILIEISDALSHVRVLPLGHGAKPSAPPENIALPEAIYAIMRGPNLEFASPVWRFNYESPVTPSSVFEWDSRTHALTLLKRQEVLGGFDGSRYTTARVHATANEGTQVPVSLVYRKDLQPGTPHPMLLTAYGSYGVSFPINFSSPNISLLDRGVVFAVGHIRGGGDLGTRWHEEGRMANKMNTFTDFIACAESLIKLGWTAPDKLVIEGASAGGLLMGAVTNLRPDLFKAVVARVPFVDVINTMLDESLPLTVGEFEEWGNPKIKGEYDVMIKYSPYDNVAKKAYPSLLVLTSYNDSQVMYWEPAKWVARLRALKTDRNPLLLRINMDPAGHGGQSGRFDRLHETAFRFAFELTQLHIDQ